MAASRAKEPTTILVIKKRFNEFIETVKSKFEDIELPIKSQDNTAVHHVAEVEKRAPRSHLRARKTNIKNRRFAPKANLISN